MLARADKPAVSVVSEALFLYVTLKILHHLSQEADLALLWRLEHMSAVFSCCCRPPWEPTGMAFPAPPLGAAAGCLPIA